MTAPESARIEAAIARDLASQTDEQRMQAAIRCRSCAAPALSWLLYGNPNKPGGER